MDGLKESAASLKVERFAPFAALSARIRDWRDRRRTAAELAMIDATGELDVMLGDAGITRAQLHTVLSTPSAATRQLDAMAAHAGVDLSALPVRVRREAEWACISCTERKACRRWLRSGTAQRFASFCPNTPAFRRWLRAAAAAAQTTTPA